MTLPEASKPTEDWKDWKSFVALFLRHCPAMCESAFTVEHPSGSMQSHEATCIVRGAVGVARYRLFWNATITELSLKFQSGIRTCTDFEAGSMLQQRGVALPAGADANCRTEEMLVIGLRRRDEIARLLASEFGKAESADALFREVEARRR